MHCLKWSLPFALAKLGKLTCLIGNSGSLPYSPGSLPWSWLLNKLEEFAARRMWRESTLRSVEISWLNNQWGVLSGSGLYSPILIYGGVVLELKSMSSMDCIFHTLLTTGCAVNMGSFLHVRSKPQARLCQRQK